MGFVISINVYDRWKMTYFVQDTNKDSAKEKAYKAFKENMSCDIPDTLEEFENLYWEDTGFIIEIVAEVYQIL